MISHVADVCGGLGVGVWGLGGENAWHHPITGVHSFDKALPLAEPLHADAVYDHRRLLLLECLVQLRSREGEEEKQKGAGEGCDREEVGVKRGWRRMEEETAETRDQFAVAVIPIRGIHSAIPVPPDISIKLYICTRHTLTRIHLSICTATGHRRSKRQ